MSETKASASAVRVRVLLRAQQRRRHVPFPAARALRGGEQARRGPEGRGRARAEVRDQRGFVRWTQEAKAAQAEVIYRR